MLISVNAEATGKEITAPIRALNESYRTLSGRSPASAFRNQDRESLDPVVRPLFHPAAA